MEIRAIVSTTHRDRHGHKLTKEDLEFLAAKFAYDRKPALTEEHDFMLPPVGQWQSATVEPTDDGEYQLVIIGEIYEQEERISLSDGTSAVKRTSLQVTHPFGDTSEKQEPQASEIMIHFDPTNFASRKEKDKFLKGIEISSDLPFLEGYLIRKAWNPNPQLIITISTSIWLALTSSKITSKVIDNLGDKISEAIGNDILKFYALVRAAVIGMLKYAVPKNRPQTFVIVLPTSPIIKLFVRSNDPDLIVSSLHPDCLLDLVQKATVWRETLKAEEVRFKLSNRGNWDLLYLLTEDGATIGRKSSFSRKATEIKINQFINKGVSIGMHEKPNPLKIHNAAGKAR